MWWGVLVFPRVCGCTACAEATSAEVMLRMSLLYRRERLWFVGTRAVPTRRIWRVVAPESLMETNPWWMQCARQQESRPGQETMGIGLQEVSRKLE